MIKQIHQKADLNRALDRSVVVMVDPKGDDRVTYLTASPKAIDRFSLTPSSAVKSEGEIYALDILKNEPVSFNPGQFPGMLFDLSINEPDPADSKESDLTIAEAIDLGEPVYRQGTSREMIRLRTLESDWPFLLMDTDSEGNEEVFQVDEFGETMDELFPASTSPTLTDDEKYALLAGYLLLSPKEGPIFLSYDLMNGLIPGVKTPGIDLNQGILVKAIQKIDRDHGVIGYFFD